MAYKCHVLRQDGAIALGHAKKWCTNVEWSNYSGTESNNMVASVGFNGI